MNEHTNGHMDEVDPTRYTSTTIMRTKPPSSLDYDGHLHELALRNWRRALNERDVPRAEIAARTLSDSSDKFWRFVGNLNLGLAHLAGGRMVAALDGFAGAARAYPDSPNLASVAKTQIAHVHLEMNSPRDALTVLADEGTSPRARYWRALTCARLSNVDTARSLAERLEDPLLRAHVLAELSGNDDDLGAELARVSDDELESPRPVVPILAGLAERLPHDDAVVKFARITNAAETLLHWPLPYVRSLYRLGHHAAALDDTALAHEAFSRFVELWRDGELDRDAVSEAAQFVKS